MPTKKCGPPSTTIVSSFHAACWQRSMFLIIYWQFLLLRCLFAAWDFFRKHSLIAHERKEHPYELEDDGAERLCLFERTIEPLLLVFVVCLEEGAPVHQSEHHEEETLP